MNGLNTRDYGHRDSRGTATIHELEILPVIEKHLGNQIIGPVIDLHFRVEYLRLHVGRLFMLLGVTSHAIRKRLFRRCERASIKTNPLIEIIHLLLQAGSVRVTVHRSLLCIEFLDIASQQQQVGYAQKRQVDQRVLRLLPGESSRNNMGYRTNAVPVLDSSRDSHRSGASPHVHLPVHTLYILFVDVLAMMRGDIDKFRIKLFQSIDRPEDLLDTVPRSEEHTSE